MRAKLLTVGLLLAGAVAVYGQAQRQPATLDDLLTEIRGLRADLRQTTRATTQMHLLTARLHREAEQQLRAQESDSSAQIAAEQNRWQDFNNRLDELERSLK